MFSPATGSQLARASRPAGQRITQLVKRTRSAALPHEPQPSCQQSPKSGTVMATMIVLAAIRQLPWRTWGRLIWVLPLSAVLVLAACSGGLGSPALAWPVIWQQLPPSRSIRALKP